jgi:hypothetical protein
MAGALPGMYGATGQLAKIADLVSRERGSFTGTAVREDLVGSPPVACVLIISPSLDGSHIP